MKKKRKVITARNPLEVFQKLNDRKNTFYTVFDEIPTTLGLMLSCNNVDKIPCTGRNTVIMFEAVLLLWYLSKLMYDKSGEDETAFHSQLVEFRDLAQTQCARLNKVESVDKVAQVDRVLIKEIYTVYHTHTLVIAEQCTTKELDAVYVDVLRHIEEDISKIKEQF